jgi:ribosomal protein S18 acetylase RimI-like enzyme
MTESKGDRLRLRDARASELDEAGLLIRDAYQEYGASFPTEVWDGYAREIMDVRSRVDDSELIVAEDRGRIVGCVTFYPRASQSDDSTWPSEWAGIRLLAVHPDARGQGIGRALMDECSRRCRQRSVPTLVLHTTEAMTVARGMYERMGFIRTPEFDFNPAPNVVVMAYRLDLET